MGGKRDGWGRERGEEGVEKEGGRHTWHFNNPQTNALTTEHSDANLALHKARKQ